MSLHYLSTSLPSPQRLLLSQVTLLAVWGLYFQMYTFAFMCISSVQSLSRVRLFATPWIAARQASLSINNSRSSPRLTCIESVMPSSHLILCCTLHWLYRSQQTVEILQEMGITRPLYLPPEKSVYMSRSNSWDWTWNNRLVPSRESTSRLYIFTLLIKLLCRVHHAKCQAGWSTSWNWDSLENINNLRYTNDTTLMAESEEELRTLLMKVRDPKSWLKTQHSKKEDHGMWSQSLHGK